MKLFLKRVQRALSTTGKFLTAHPIFFTAILAFVTSVIAYSFWIITNGATAITKIDSFWQQVPFYRDGWEKVHSGSFVFWSWNNMQGADYYGSNLFYYIWSPFFRIITLFPKQWIPQMMLAMNILKFVIGATLFATFLRILGYKKWYSLVIGGLLYGFSGPMIINIFFNHFNDYFAFFPLLLIASEYYLKKKRRIWLSFTFGLLGIINPYFIIFTFIIFAIYLIARWLILYPFSWKAFFIEIACAVFYVGLGFGIALFVILPFVTQSSYSPRTGRFSDLQPIIDQYGLFAVVIAVVQMITAIPTFLFPPSRIQAIEPFYNLTVQWQSLTVYAGSLPLLFVTQVKDLTSKRTYKIIKYTGILLIFLLVTPFFNNLVALATSITHRWSYLLIAFIIIPTVHVIEHHDKINRDKLKKSALIIALAMVFFVAFPTSLGPISYNSESFFISFIIRNALPTIFFLIVTTFILLADHMKKYMWVGLITLTVVQSSFSTAMFIGYNSAPTGNVVSYDEIQKRQTRSDIINEMVSDNKLNRLSDRFWIDEFSQTDYSQFAFNHSLYYNVNNQLIYHSLYNSSTNPYYNWTHGFYENQTFWARNVEMNQVYFDNLNINYIITQNPEPNFIPSQFKRIQIKDTTLGKYYLYKNTGNSGFFKSYTKELSNSDISSAYPIHVSPLLNEYIISSENNSNAGQVIINQKKDDYSKTMKEFLSHIGNSIWTSDVEFTISSPTDYTFKPETSSGDYVFYNSRDVTIYVNNKKLDTSNYCLPETSRSSITCQLISVPVQTNDVLKIEFKPNNYSLTRENRFGFVKNTFDDYQKAINEQRINYTFNSFHENGFSADVEVTKENSYTYMAVPFAKGQKFIVDGVEKTPEVVNGGYLAFKLPVGKHQITMSYISPGFIEGSLVSAFALSTSACILIFSFYKSRKNKKQK